MVEVEVRVGDEIQCERHIVQSMSGEGVGGVQDGVEVVRPVIVGIPRQDEDVHVGLGGVTTTEGEVGGEEERGEGEGDEEGG